VSAAWPLPGVGGRAGILDLHVGLGDEVEADDDGGAPPSACRSRRGVLPSGVMGGRVKAVACTTPVDQ